jgi:hypothetical protein
MKYYQTNKIDIPQIVSYHAPNKKYEVINFTSTKMNIDKNHFMTIMIPKKQCIFTEIDINGYKFKNIPDENMFYIIHPLENTYVVFDSSRFYVGEGIKINIYHENIEEIESQKDYEETDCQKIHIQEIELDEFKMSIDLKNIIYKTITITGPHGKIINSYKKDYILYEKYGAIADELKPYIENTPLQEGNRFLRMKVIENVLSQDVCHWIIHESEKQIWSDCVHTNYSSCISIEKIPAVLNFVLYACHYWLAEVKRIYDIEMMLNIKEIFVSKNTRNQIKTNDNAFIILNIQLNQTYEPIEYNEAILLKQGDMIVYNKKTLRTRGDNYALVVMVDF